MCRLCAKFLERCNEFKIFPCRILSRNKFPGIKGIMKGGAIIGEVGRPVLSLRESLLMSSADHRQGTIELT